MERVARTAFQVGLGVSLTSILCAPALFFRCRGHLSLLEGARVADYTHNVVVPEQSHGLTHALGSNEAILEGLKRARVEQVTVAELAGSVQRHEKAVVGHSLVHREVVPKSKGFRSVFRL